jgi:hypothetical protein
MRRGPSPDRRARAAERDFTHRVRLDESSLIDALRSNGIRGAALHVFEGEPRVNPEWLTLDNGVLTLPTASAGAATRDATGLLAVGSRGRARW